MEKFIFISNLKTSLLSKKENFIYTEKNINEIIKEFNGNLIVENVKVDYENKIVTENNIKTLLSEIKNKKSEDDERDVTIISEYKLVINNKVIHTIVNTINGFLTKRKTGKSNIWFENYINVKPVWNTFSSLSEEEKNKKYNTELIINKLFGRFIINKYDINVETLNKYYSLKLEKESTNYEFEYVFDVKSNGDDLIVYYKKYITSKQRGGCECLFSEIIEFNVDFVIINVEMKRYFDYVNDTKEIDELNEKKKLLKNEIDKLEASRPHYNPSYSSNSYNDNFDFHGKEGSWEVTDY